MPSSIFIRCLADAVKHGRISRRRAEELRKSLIERPDLDDAQAMEQLAERIADVSQKKRAAILQAGISEDRVTNAMNHPRGPATGASAYLTRDVTGQATYVPVEKQYRAILGRFHGKWAEAISAMRTRSLGFARDVAMVRDVVAELHGKNTGNAAAKGYARTFTEIADEARIMFNEAGGDIKYRQDWGSPQFHDARRITAAGKERWTSETLPLLDPNKMYNADGTRMSAAQLPAVLDSVYDNIATRGFTGEYADALNVKGRHQDPRILAFKDADAWLKYQDAFGETDLFHGLTQHIDSMAREIGLMQVLGPDPDITYARLREQAAAHGGWVNQMDHVYDALTGRMNRPGAVRAAQVSAGIRANLSAAKLGGAFLSSLSDWSFQLMTTHYNGIPFTRVAKRYFELMKPGSEEGRIFAVKLGLTAEGWLSRLHGQGRVVEEISGHGMWQKMSEAVYRASLLQSSTQSGRWAFGMEFMSTLADHLGKPLSQIAEEAPPLARALERYGITDRLWSDLSDVATVEFEGARFVSVDRIMQSDLDPFVRTELVSRLLNMVDSEADFAVPMPDARVRGHLLQGTRPGTVPGELMRFGTLWRSFAFTTLYTHVARGLYQGTPQKMGQYLAALAISTTAVGALAYQAKQVSKGLDMMDWEDPRLWVAGFFQGGGAGIFGDFVQGSMRNRYGNSFLATLMGPGAAALEDVYSLTLANLGAVGAGQDPRLPKDMVQFAARYTPGSSLWYTRAAFDRLIIDQLSQMVDRPGAQRSFRNKEKFWLEEAGIKFWWRPGQTEPDRAPSLGVEHR